jgi:hypothetical protein
MYLGNNVTAVVVRNGEPFRPYEFDLETAKAIGLRQAEGHMELGMVFYFHDAETKDELFYDANSDALYSGPDLAALKNGRGCLPSSMDFTL